MPGDCHHRSLRWSERSPAAGAARGSSSGASASPARSARRSRGEDYWGRPIPGFGDPRARILVLGLAPAAHGANRTGRVFTGDRSGDFLFAALHRAGLANQPRRSTRDDGLRLDGVWVTAAVRCAPPANKPTPAERDACLPWTGRRAALLPEVRVVVCLGALAWDAALRLRAAAGSGAASRPRFGHGALVEPADGPSCWAAFTPASRTRSPAG